MKAKLLTYITLGVVMLAGCAKDNFDAPSSTLSGHVVQTGTTTALGLRSNGLQLELWQPGFPTFVKIPVYIAQDGFYSVSLFDGDYRLNAMPGSPWVDRQTDSLTANVRGSLTLDMPVAPFFIVRDVTYVKGGTAAAPTVTANFTVQQTNSTKALDLAKVYIGQTTIVDNNNNITSGQLTAAQMTVPTGGTKTISITTPVPNATTDVGRRVIEQAKKGYVYVRVGVKTAGVSEYIYSAPVKLTLP